MIDALTYYVVGFSLTIISMLGGSMYWLGRRLISIEDRIDYLEKRIETLERQLRSLADSIRSAVVSINSMLVEFLGIKGLLTKDEAELLRNETQRMSSGIRVNPISKEEAEFIRSVFSKNLDDITVEELERVAEIAKRWWEDGSEVAYRIFLNAWTIRTYKIHEQAVKRRAAGGEGRC